MKKLLTIFISVLIFNLLNAQTGIGTTTPNASAKLEVFSTNKGFLPPRVSLTDIYDQTTIASPATGLLVYCKGDAGLAAGYYYWNGNAWATIATPGGSGSFASSYLRGSRTATQNLAVGGVVTFTNIDNSSGTDISLNTSTGKITLAPGNTYRIRGAVPNFSSGQRPAFIWYNETTSSNIGSATFSYNPGDAASLGAFGAPAELVFTPNVTTVVYLKLLSSLGSGSVTVGGNGDFSTTGSYPWFDIQVISGNAPVTGQSVDYAMASLSANQTISSVSNVLFNTIQGTGITLNNGGFNLIANKTYKLEASVGGSSTGYIYYAWVDASNTIISGGSIGSVMKAGGAYSDGPQDKAVAIYTPTSNTTVYLRVLTITGTSVAYPPLASPTYSSTWATISQIGSSAIVNPWVLSGNNVYNNTGNVGIGNASPTQALDVTGNINVTGKINLTDPSGNVIAKAAGIVNANVPVTLGDIQVQLPGSGSIALQIKTTGTSFSGYYVSHALYSTSGNVVNANNTTTVTSTMAYLNPSWSTPNAGDVSVYYFIDNTNKRFFRFTYMVGYSYNNNFISIERLL